MKKSLKSLLSLLLVLVMVLGIVAVPAAADSKRKFNYYVSLGDSITAGAPYYDPYAENVWVEGKYPILVKRAVNAEDGFQGGRCGWRSNELRVILDDDYDGDDFTVNFLNQWGVQNQTDLIEARGRYREHLKKADLITVAVASNDLLGNTTRVSRELSNSIAAANPLKAVFDAAVAALQSSGLVAFAQLVSAAGNIGILPTLMSESVKAMEKGTADFKENFDVIIRKLRELNPTAEIVCLGTYTNPSSEYGELSVALAQPFVDEINSYISTGCPYRDQYRYADISGIDMTPGHTPDGRHPDDAGHAFIAGKVLDALGIATVDATPFVDRLYRVCLDREASPEEIAYYVNLLANGSTGTEIASIFVFSDEFKMKNYCDRHFTVKLYETLMGRTPAEDEIANWVWRLQQGATREGVFNEFAASQEFASICAMYAIDPGEAIPVIGKGTKPGGYCSVEGCTSSESVAEFAKRLYLVCLDREPGTEERDAWHYYFVHGDHTATTAAKLFLFSPEFQSKGYDDEQYVLHLYAALMNRVPAEGELSYWVNQISGSGMTREMVFNGFATSDEFKVICAQYGVVHS